MTAKDCTGEASTPCLDSNVISCGFVRPWLAIPVRAALSPSGRVLSQWTGRSADNVLGDRAPSAPEGSLGHALESLGVPRRPHLSDVLSLHRLPGVPDVFHRVRIPDDLDAATTRGAEEEPEAAGLDSETVERIWEGAASLYRTGVHPGLSLCVRREGKVVIDRAIGHARGNGPDDPEDVPKVPMRPDTPACIFSASKAVTAMVVHQLDERGLLHIGDRVSEYIPEYAQNGKEGTTIAHVLAHRAGVASMPKEARELDSLIDADRILQLICKSKPAIRPGRLLAYHAVSGGFILGEIVKRVTGKSIRAGSPAGLIKLKDPIAVEPGVELPRPLGHRGDAHGTPAHARSSFPPCRSGRIQGM